MEAQKKEEVVLEEKKQRYLDAPAPSRRQQSS